MDLYKHINLDPRFLGMIRGFKTLTWYGFSSPVIHLKL